MGFNQVDSLLYTYTLGKIATDNTFLEMFEFKDKETSQIFNKYIEYDGIKFKLREGYDLNTIVNLKPNQNIELPLYKVLNTNKNLIEYLKKLDYKEIIVRKIISLGISRIVDYEDLFSDKEKEIIYQMFGIDKIHQKLSRRQLQIYENMMRQEEKNNERMIAYIDNIISSKNNNKIKKLKENVWTI